MNEQGSFTGNKKQQHWLWYDKKKTGCCPCIWSPQQLREMFAIHQFDDLDNLLEQEHQIWLDDPNLPYSDN
ncbi:DUF4034 domain-containing protein [Pectobacterium araliae]|uniref:DUF4034 domain-containing protein n=1 Tax=Pectobacterium araliae TaxID=3073862 RepID=UPI003CE52670